MSVELQPSHRVPAEQLHAAFLQAFADYLIGPFDLPFDRWPHFLGRQCVDLTLSRVAVVDGSVIAFAFVAQRAGGSRWRLATMGALPAARGSGVAQALMDDWIERAMAAEIEALELEAFAQNERAVRLYRSHGFSIVHELHGFEGTIGSELDLSPELQGDEVALASAFAWLDKADRCAADLPLQVTTASLAAVPDPLRAWRLDTAQIILSLNGQGAVAIHCLLDLDPGQRNAEALVQGLRRHFAGRRVVVPPLQRLDLGGQALQRSGLRPQPLHQLMMSRKVRL